jgi:3-phenylpropionate/trans-cinnamate dioxygenase ferredoxin reductase subunit
VHYLRSLSDALRLRQALAGGGRLVVVGAGFLGSEVAASARSLGIDVTVVEALAVPLATSIGSDLGGLIAAIHQEHGVSLLTQSVITGIRVHDGEVEVTCGAGQRIACDLVMVAAGMRPNTDLAEAAGLACEGGILVDEYCRSSNQNVLAAGDVARHRHPLFGRMRVEHYENALKQGGAAAATALGLSVPYQDPHWFWSDFYEYKLEAVGIFDRYDEVVSRGSRPDRSFTDFFLLEGRVLGAVGLNSHFDVRRAARLIADGVPVAATQLRDPAVDLRRLH